MIPKAILEKFTRVVPWEEVDGQDEGAPLIEDPALFKAWELGELLRMPLPLLESESLVQFLHRKLSLLLPGAEVGDFDANWKKVYEKYGFLHLRSEVDIEGETYYVEIFCGDPHGEKRLDDAVLSNARYPLGGKHFYM